MKPIELVIAWDEDEQMYGIYQWCNKTGDVGDALDHAETIEEANNRREEIKENLENLK